MSLTKATYSMIEGAPVNVLDYGADPTGVADSLTAMQAAHDTGRIVYYPAGTYRFSGQLTIALGGIIGDGKTLTNLNAIDTSSNAAIKYTGAYTTLSGGLVSGPPTFYDFTLNGNFLKTTGAGLQFESATGSVDYIILSSVVISYFPINVDFVKASLWKMIGCDILGHTVAGIRVNNTDVNDAGDSVIADCHIITSSTTAKQILQLTSGGLKIIGNKFLGGGNVYSLQYTGVGNTSNLIISANSMENFSDKAMSFEKVSAGLTEFLNVVITGNQISVALGTPTVYLIANDGGTWLKCMTITGNNFQLPGITNSYGISLNGVSTLTISGNTFRGNGGTSQAIALTSCVDVNIGINTYSNITIPYSLITPGANNFVNYDSYSGKALAVPSATTTTIFTLPALEAGAHYSMSAGIPLVGGGDTSTVRIGCDGLTYFITGSDAAVASMLVTFSGLNVRVTQNTGVAQDVAWSWRRIA